MHTLAENHYAATGRGCASVAAPILAMALTCILPAGGAGGAERPPAQSYAERVREIHRNTTALEGAWYRLMQQAHRETLPELLILTLEKPVQARDLQVELVRSPVIGAWAQAWAPRLNRAVHDVEIAGLECEGDRSKGAIKGTFEVRLSLETDPLGQQMMDGQKELFATISVTARAIDGKLTGTYTLEPKKLPGKTEKDPPRPNPLPAAKGAIGGTWTRIERVLEANPERWSAGEGDGLHDLYVTARALERVADRWYQRIRALDVMRRYKVNYAEALRETTLPEMERPELKLEARSEDKDALGGGVEELGDPGEEPAEEGIVKAKAKGKGKDKGGGKSARESDAQRGLALLDGMSSRVSKIVEVVARHEKATEDPPPVVETVGTEDLEFGPWYGETHMEVGKGGANTIPADAGGDGLQDWKSVVKWEAFGPFPLTRFEFVTPRLPDLLWTGGETCRARQDLLKDYKGPDLIGWTDCPAPGSADFGYIMPPKWFGFNPYYRGLPPVLGYREYQNQGHYGLPYSTAFLRCVIESPKDAELWAGLGVNRQGRLWLGETLIWQGPARPDPLRHETVHLIRIPFRKGPNRLTMRVDVEWSSPFMWLRLCMRGRPRPASEVKAKTEAMEAMRRELKPAVAVGWRGDGTGMYPGTRPPVAWHQKRRLNVLWHTPASYFGNATPVPVPGTNRVFVTVDPHWLVCLDKDTGKELWRRAVTLLDLLPEAERKAGWALYEEWWKKRQDRDSTPVFKGAGKMKYPCPKWLTYKWYWAEGTGIWAPGKEKAKDERDGATPELVALLDKRDELEKAPDQVGVQDELNAVLKKIEKLQTQSAADDPESPISKDAAVDKAEGALVAFLRKCSHVAGMGGGYWQDYTGWTFATPVTDGKHVWIKTGADVAACYDMDGNEKWKVQIWGAGNADHMLNSPRLVDGKLVMQLLDNDPDPKKPPRGGVKLVALDAATGAKVWETRGLSDNAWNDSTPAVMTLMDGRESVRVVVTTCGTVVRASDGKVLVFNPGVQGGFASPLVYEDTVVFGAAALAPIQYIMQNRDQVGFRRLWTVQGGAHGVLDSGGALVDCGIIWQTVPIGQSGHRGGEGIAALGMRAMRGPGEGWRAVEGYDLLTGRYAGAIPILRKGGNQWSPACASEKHAYHIVGDHIFQSIGPKAPMDMVTVTREKQPLRLANNAIDRTYGAGAIDGDRMYLRGYYGVTCIGYTGDEGRRYEARTVARNLLDDLYPERPQDSAVREIPTAAQFAVTYDKRGGGILLSGESPAQWWILGPMTPEVAPQAMKAFGIPAKGLKGDEKLKVGGVECAWGPLSQSFIKAPDFKDWELDPANFTDIHRMRRVVDLGKAVQGRTNSVICLMAELKIDKPRTLRLEQTLPGTRCWVGGVEVKHGDRLKFGEGAWQMFLEVTVTTVPPEGLHLSPRFWDSDDVKKESADWDAAAKRRATYLDEAIRLAADSPEAAAARRLLAEVR